MDALLDSLLPYLDSGSFSYNPTVGMEATSLDLYYNHSIYVGCISGDYGRLYLSIRVVSSEHFRNSFPSYYNDLDKFLNRFNLKPMLKLKEWSDIHQQVYEILSPKVSLGKYLEFLDTCKHCMTKASVEQYIRTLRKIQDEFG